MNQEGAGPPPDRRAGSPFARGSDDAAGGGEGKAELRRRILAWRDALPPEQVSSWSAAIAMRLFNLPAFRQARTVLFYLSFRNEVATPPMIARALASGIRVCIPETVPAERRMIPRLIAPSPLWGMGEFPFSEFPFSDLPEALGLVPGPMGLWQPDPARCPAVVPEEIDLVLVPGVAFDRRGYRLGFGHGYYDRFLPGLPERVRRVGLAFSGQVVEAVPADPWDVPLHGFVTEDGVIDIRMA